MTEMQTYGDVLAGTQEDIDHLDLTPDIRFSIMYIIYMCKYEFCLPLVLHSLFFLNISNPTTARLLYFVESKLKSFSQSL